MNKLSLRITIVSFFLLLSGGLLFAVLVAEEDKRIAKVKAEQEQFLANAREIEQSRQAYLDGIAQSREASRLAMDEAKKQYEQLLLDQPALVQKNQKQATTVVPQLKPVASTSNVKSTQKSKPKSTRTTKTS